MGSLANQNGFWSEIDQKMVNGQLLFLALTMYRKTDKSD